MLEELVMREDGVMEFRDGVRVAYAVRVDTDALARYIRAALKTKTGRSKRLHGAMTIEAKKLPDGGSR